MPSRMLEPCTVYFVLAPRSRLIRIGATKDLERRVLEMLHYSPEKCSIAATVTGTWADESHLQRRYEPGWSHGDWFHIHAELELLIRTIRLHGRLPSWARGTAETVKWWRPDSGRRGRPRKAAALEEAA